MEQYRNKMEIMASLLSAAMGQWTTKTKLMYRSSLSYNQMKPYMGLMRANELLDFDTTTALYMTSEKGKQFLQRYAELKSLISIPCAT